MRIRAEFGRDSVEVTVPAGTTVAQLKANARVRGGLGLTDNVNAIIDGDNANDAAELGDGDVVQFETRVGQKAVLA